MNASRPNIRWIDPASPAEAFPDPDTALTEPNGLLAIGGDLSVERLLAAYRRGIFPWYSEGQPILWWSPNPRAVLFPVEMRISRSLARTLRRNVFTASVDQAFVEVVTGCADRGAHEGTWITAEMAEAYAQLHTAGHAHSIEIWSDGELSGGLYGVNLGRVFFAESMFHRKSDASKVALTKLSSLCRANGIELIDCQMASTHLASLGSREISRREFNQLLSRLTTYASPGDWNHPVIQSDRLP